MVKAIRQSGGPGIAGTIDPIKPVMFKRITAIKTRMYVVSCMFLLYHILDVSCKI